MAGRRTRATGFQFPPIGRIPHPRLECRARTAVAPSGRACEVEDDAREVEDDARSGGPFVFGLGHTPAGSMGHQATGLHRPITAEGRGP